jgi:hypothetical protein
MAAGTIPTATTKARSRQKPGSKVLVLFVGREVRGRLWCWLLLACVPVRLGVSWSGGGGVGGNWVFGGCALGPLGT